MPENMQYTRTAISPDGRKAGEINGKWFYVDNGRPIQNQPSKPIIKKLVDTDVVSLANAPGTPAYLRGLTAYQRITNAGAPSWSSPTPIPTAYGQDTAPESLGGSISRVDPGAKSIIVSHPEQYTPAVAAHEATHVFQNSRNSNFQNAINGLLPSTTSAQDYNYGGSNGLKANPRKSVGNYNPEQQASMVESLTKLNQTNPNTLLGLQSFDDQKAALERPINQLMRIPPKDTSMAGKIDDGLNALGVIARPISYLRDMVSLPKMDTSSMPDPTLAAPSAALGYPNRSKLVADPNQLKRNLY